VSPGHGYRGAAVGAGRGGLYGQTPVENGAPPSTYAIAAFLEGEPGSTARLIGTTVLRSVFIVPGVWVASKVFAREADLSMLQIGAMGLTASSTITAGLLLWYWLKRRMVASAGAQA
jgi:hypothetical protein